MSLPKYLPPAAAASVLRGVPGARVACAADTNASGATAATVATAAAAANARRELHCLTKSLLEIFRKKSDNLTVVKRQLRLSAIGDGN